MAASQWLSKRVLWNTSPARCSVGIKKGSRIIKLGKDTLEPSWRFMIYTFVQQAPYESRETPSGSGDLKLSAPCSQPGAPAAEPPAGCRCMPTHCAVPSPILATRACDFNHLSMKCDCEKCDCVTDPVKTRSDALEKHDKGKLPESCYQITCLEDLKRIEKNQ